MLSLTISKLTWAEGLSSSPDCGATVIHLIAHTQVALMKRLLPGSLAAVIGQ